MTSNSPPRGATTRRTTGIDSCRSLAWVFVLLVAGSLLLLPEISTANKFETIGGGVSGSVSFKREWLQLIFFVAAGICALGAMLVVVMPHNNPLFLNYRNWKASSLMMGLFAVALGTAGLLI